MNFALRLMVARVSGAVTLAGAMACVPSAAVAGYVVDTGEPLGDALHNSWSIFNYTDAGGFFNELGGSFLLASAQTLTAVEVWIITIQPGDFMVSLWSGAPTTSGTPLFTTKSSLGISDRSGRWETFGGLSWEVGPGTYTVTFKGAPSGYQGLLVSDAPFALPDYYIRDFNAPEWTRFADRPPPPRGGMPLPNLGIRIAAIPEPEAYALMLAGLGIVGVAARRRKA